ncbi:MULTISPECIES: histidine--tRNA ligase [unclassified Sulfitobacter]|uniref:histidine--tRNA ligase n=1 Tax=unclassified Sulfitobacter TaxID=196795 RepID=UPI0007C206CE|nr:MULTISPECIES: histidine--tRNA ligase [unclassified Sulfitobacter]KZY06163.1 histidine--tRNA ligase [Sulfitobacter sp. HI0023]KZY23865.1 histidine--tRNA ligase [Sulfitobacter sp. HI0040]KZZ68343.1 histidine--tRNA ligase [Sulfitobacter sp. HI0129]
MAKTKKSPRPKAETPKGFRDYFGVEVTRRTEMLARIAAVYHRYGFDALESSGVETVEALGKFLPDVDRPNEGVFAWQEDAESDKPGDWLALRYDLTAPLARVYAQHRNDLPTPYRRYAMGPVWRNEKPGPGRFRQFYQCDADTVGASSVAADAEICAMLADCLEEVGIARGDYVVRINNRKVLNGVLEVAGLSGDDKEAERGIVLRAIDKLDRLGPDGVRALLGEGRKDDSGDFTKGAGLSEEQIVLVMGFVSANDEVLAQIEHLNQSSANYSEDPIALDFSNELRRVFSEADRSGTAPSELRNKLTISYLRRLVSDSVMGLEGVHELGLIADLLSAQEYFADRIVIDPSVVRGLGYYTGPVYEAELTFEIEDEKGRKRNFGSVAGGGRYDDLVKRFTGQEVPATGVSIGVDRLLAALEAKGRLDATHEGPVVVTVMDRDRMADYQSMVAELRSAGIRAEVYLGNPKNFGNQLKYADRRNSPVAVIEGGDEKDRGVVQIKDLILGAKLAQDATLEEWKDRPSQYEVPRDELVSKVREILDLHR